MTYKEARTALGLPIRSKCAQQMIQAAYAKRLNDAHSSVVLAVSVSARNRANTQVHQIHEAKRICLEHASKHPKTKARPCCKQQRRSRSSRSKMQSAFVGLGEACAQVHTAVKTVLAWLRSVISCIRDAADELADTGIPKFVTITTVVVIVMAFVDGCTQTINKIIGG